MGDFGCCQPGGPGDLPAVPHDLTPLEAAAAVAAACRAQALSAGAYAVIARTRGQGRLAGVLSQAGRTLATTAAVLDAAAAEERARLARRRPS